MTIHQQHPNDDTNSGAIAQKNVDTESEETADESSEAEAPKPVNLQKRDYDLDAVRYGDWELNGRCIDF